MFQEFPLDVVEGLFDLLFAPLERKLVVSSQLLLGCLRTNRSFLRSSFLSVWQLDLFWVWRDYCFSFFRLGLPSFRSTGRMLVESPSTIGVFSSPPVEGPQGAACLPRASPLRAGVLPVLMPDVVTL